MVYLKVIMISHQHFCFYQKKVKFEERMHTIKLDKASPIKCLPANNICPSCASDLGKNIKLHKCNE